MKNRRLFSAMALILALLMTLSACGNVAGWTPAATPDVARFTLTPDSSDEEYEIFLYEYLKTYTPTGRDILTEKKEINAKRNEEIQADIENGTIKDKIYIYDVPDSSLEKNTLNLYEDFIVYTRHMITVEHEVIDNYEYMKNEQKALAELENRQDAVTVLLQRYAYIYTQYSVDPITMAVERRYLEQFLVQDFYLEKLTNNELLLYIYISKQLSDYIFIAIPEDALRPCAKRAMDEYNRRNEIMLMSTITSYDLLDGEEIPKTILYGWHRYDGNTVEAWSYDPDYDFDTDDINAKEITYDFLYGDSIEYLEEPTLKYNCHSYAWYLDDHNKNTVWIPYADPYFDDLSNGCDPHVTEIENESDVLPGDIVVWLKWGTSAHSAVVYSVDSNDEIYCISKWGADFLIRHHIDIVAPDYLQDGVAYRRYYRVNQNAPHIYGQNVDNETNLPLCTKCSDTISNVGHTWSDEYEYRDTTIHIKTCTICKYKSIGSHIIIDYDEWFSDADGHYNNCIYCDGRTSSVPHTFSSYTWCNDYVHSYTCSVCGYTSTEHHTAEGDVSGHTSSRCSKCSRSVAPNHAFSSWQSDSSTQHSKTCKICAYNEYGAHNLMTETDTTAHWQACTICPYETTHTNHFFMLWTDYNEAFHKRTCRSCSYIHYEAHSAPWGSTICSTCGRDGFVSEMEQPTEPPVTE